MNSRLIKKFDCYPFSAARRYFVLQQLLSETDSDEITQRCQAIIAIDRVILRCESDRRHPFLGENAQMVHHYAFVSSLEEQKVKAHRQFVSLIRYVFTNLPPAQARRLMAPAVRQLQRLQNFAYRNLRHDGLSSSASRTAAPADSSDTGLRPPL